MPYATTLHHDAGCIVSRADGMLSLDAILDENVVWVDLLTEHPNMRVLVVHLLAARDIHLNLTGT